MSYLTKQYKNRKTCRVPRFRTGTHPLPHKELTFTVLGTRFVKQQAEIAVAKEAKFRQDIILKRPAKKKVTHLSPLPDRYHVSLKTFQDYEKDKKKDASFSNHHSQSSSCSKCGSRGHAVDHEVGKHNKGPRGIQVLKLVKTTSPTHLTSVTIACKSSPNSTAVIYLVR